jgi:rare lipoprotein A
MFRYFQFATLVLATLLLTACGSSPRRADTRDMPASIEEHAVGAGGYLAGDGPGTDIPANIDAIPDAVPVSEPLHKFANRPYVALGKNYMPLTVAGNFKEHGIASWYGKKFHGQRTSSGEVYDMYAMTAAHPILPIPSYARITNTANGKSVVVRVNDRGPFLHERVIDLSYTAAHKLGIIGNGSAEVEIESLSSNIGTKTIAKTDAVQSKPLEKAESANSKSVVADADTTLPAASGNVYLQLGAFKSQDAAEGFMAKMRAELGDLGKQLSIFTRDGLMRVHLGPYASQDEARSSAEGLRGRLGFKPLLNLR